MPNLMQSTCSSDEDCNGEGKCVQADNGTTTYCDCTIGYIEPHCKNRDPCMLEGDAACQNGSTCKRRSNFDYECMCRVPYSGEFCETYDLCHVDVDECIDDLNRDDPMDPICHPCAARSSCTQISKRHYVCSCEKGYNHSSCYAYNATNTDHPPVPKFLSDNLTSRSYWSPIIPTIAMTSCCLYFIILLIVLILLRKRKKFRPRLIVCCDIREFDELSYYLISVETGKQWRAGTKGNVFCFLCGEHGQAGPYPLYDRNLAEVQTLQRCQEDNYLVSHTMDIGQVDKIVLWFDDKPASSTWFCDKITVRNVKTEKNWFFYVSTWFDSKNHKKRHEFLVATTEYVRKRSEHEVGINCQHYCYQMQRHHSYISPFIYPSPEVITLMFTEWMSYMLILICLYGFLSICDPDIDYVGNYVFRVIVPENGSLTAFACWWIVLTCALLLVLFVRIKRIPTLIIWHNKPGMSDEPIKKRRPKPKRPPPVPKTKDEATETDMLKASKATFTIVERADVYLDEVPYAESQNLFRIPSTDVVRTEEWVEGAVDQTPKDELTDDVFVHSYDPSRPQAAPDAVLNYGLVGGLTDGRQQKPNRFVYATNSNESNPVCAGIEKDIEDIYGDFPFATESTDTLQTSNSQYGPDDLNGKANDEYGPADLNGKANDEYGPADLNGKANDEYGPADINDDPSGQYGPDVFNDNTNGLPSRKITIDEIPMEDSKTLEISKSNLQLLGAGDFSHDTIIDNQAQLYCELCEMEIDRFWNLLAKICVIIGWILCIITIIAATVICCIYGGRYGYQRTYDWIISLVICWLESFLFYQFIKVLFVVIIVSILIKRKKLPSFEARKVSERFQVYYANGLTVFPEKRDLKFVQYLPNTWIPISHVKLDRSTVSSDTNITHGPDKNV